MNMMQSAIFQDLSIPITPRSDIFMMLITTLYLLSTGQAELPPIPMMKITELSALLSLTEVLQQPLMMPQAE